MAIIGGTEVNVGLGVETTPGTAVAATIYPQWQELSLQSVSEKLNFTSQRGIRNMSSNSIIRRKYSEGNLSIVPDVTSSPYLFYLALGSKATAGPTDLTYTHTFTVQNADASMKTMTVLIENAGIVTERYANCVVNTLALDVSDGFAKLTAGLLGGFPDTGTVTESFTQETEYAYSQYYAQFGTSLTNAAGSVAIETLTSDATAPADGATIVIGGITYTAKTTLTNSGYTPYEVLINTTAAAFLTNLKKAINGNGTAGTDYGIGTVAHPQVICTGTTATVLTINSRVSGTAVNSIATTQAGTSHCTWQGATMTSGTPGTGPDPLPLKAFSLNINNNVQQNEAFLSGSNLPQTWVAGRLEVTGTYTLHFKDTVELAKYQANTKSAAQITFSGATVSTGGTAESITIKLGRLVLTKPPKQIDLNGVVVLQQEFTVEYDATDKEITVAIKNAVASYA